MWLLVRHRQSFVFTALNTRPHPVQSPLPGLYPTPRAIKYLPTTIRTRNLAIWITKDSTLHAFNKPQIPKSIWIKVFDYQFPSNPRPRPSVASADRRVGQSCSQQGGIPPRSPPLKLMQRSLHKDTICDIWEVPHKNCFPECILFNNLALDWRKKCNIHTDKCPTLFRTGPLEDREDATHFLWLRDTRVHKVSVRDQLETTPARGQGKHTPSMLGACEFIRLKHDPKGSQQHINHRYKTWIELGFG